MSWKPHEDGTNRFFDPHIFRNAQTNIAEWLFNGEEPRNARGNDSPGELEGGLFGEGESDDVDCYICLTGVQANMGCRGDCCPRIYHPECLARMLVNSNGNCPQCRVPVFTDNYEDNLRELIQRHGLNYGDLVAENFDTSLPVNLRRSIPPVLEDYFLQCYPRQRLVTEGLPPVFFFLLFCYFARTLTQAQRGNLQIIALAHDHRV